MTITTWSAAHTQASSTLSGGALTLTNAQGALYGGSRSTTSRTTGKVHVELLFTPSLPDGGGGNSELIFGLAPPSYDPAVLGGGPDMNNNPGNWTIQPDGYVLFDGVGIPLTEQAGEAAVAAWWTGASVLGMDVDFDAGKLWFSVDGSYLVVSGADPGLNPVPDPETGANPLMTFAPGTELYVACSQYSSNPPNPNVATANFGASAFAYGPPFGFTAWDVPSEDYTRLITSEHRDKPNYLAVVRALTNFAVDERALLLGLPDDFDVDDAVGVQLDAVALWAGVARVITIEPSEAFPVPADPYQVELDDGTLRRLVKARVLANRWDGTPEQAVVILAAFYGPAGSAAAVVDNQDMSVDLILAGTFPTAAEAAVLSQFILPVRPAGVFVKNTYISPVGGPLFGLDIDNTFIGGPDHGSFGVPFI